jgi:hypothetical protein
LHGRWRSVQQKLGDSREGGEILSMKYGNTRKWSRLYWVFLMICQPVWVDRRAERNDLEGRRPVAGRFRSDRMRRRSNRMPPCMRLPRRSPGWINGVQERETFRSSHADEM